MDEDIPLGRLTLRVEGEWWCAYYAAEDTMDYAMPLGTIGMAYVRDHPARKAAFMALMQAVVGDIIESVVGDRPEWGATRAAPDYERKR